MLADPLAAGDEEPIDAEEWARRLAGQQEVQQQTLANASAYAKVHSSLQDAHEESQSWRARAENAERRWREVQPLATTSAKNCAEMLSKLAQAKSLADLGDLSRLTFEVRTSMLALEEMAASALNPRKGTRGRVPSGGRSRLAGLHAGKVGFSAGGGGGGGGDSGGAGANVGDGGRRSRAPRSVAQSASKPALKGGKAKATGPTASSSRASRRGDNTASTGTLSTASSTPQLPHVPPPAAPENPYAGFLPTSGGLPAVDMSAGGWGAANWMMPQPFAWAGYGGPQPPTTIGQQPYSFSPGVGAPAALPAYNYNYK